MARQQDRIRRVREALHTATTEIDDAMNLDPAEYGDVILSHVSCRSINLLMIIYEGDLKEIHDALKAYL